MPSLTISEIDALKFRKKLPSFDAQTREYVEACLQAGILPEPAINVTFSQEFKDPSLNDRGSKLSTSGSESGSSYKRQKQMLPPPQEGLEEAERRRLAETWDCKILKFVLEAKTPVEAGYRILAVAAEAHRWNLRDVRKTRKSVSRAKFRKALEDLEKMEAENAS